MLAVALVGLLLAGTGSPQALVPLEIRAPEYPEVAVKARMADTVRVEVFVTTDGSVASSAVVSKSPLLLSAAAIKAAREWHFVPPSESTVRKLVLTFEFTVDTEAPSEGQCLVGPPTISVYLPTNTVRIRGWFRPPPPTVTY
jgi:TonB family protein